MSKVKEYLKENYILVIAFAVASIAEVVVFWPTMCADYLSYDSSYQYALTQHTVSEIWQLLPYDYSPPFYAIALKLYCNIFGTSLLAMRSFSLFAFVGIYFMSTFPMNALFGKKSALVCLVMTFSTKNILNTSHEIRPTIYAFFFFIAVAVYAGIVFYQGKRYAYICLTVFSVLAMYTHNFSLVGTFSIYIVLLLFMLFKKEWKKLRNVFISGCICAVLYIPWLGVILSQISNVQSHYWETSCGFSDVLSWIFTDYKNSYSNNLISDIISLMISILLALVLFKHIDFKKLKGAKTFKGVVRFAADKSVYTNILFLLLCLVLSIVIMEFVSIFMHNIRSQRYYYIFAMMWIVILSAIIGNLGDKACCAIFSVLMVVNHIMNIAYVNEKIKNADMTEIVEEVNKRNPDGNVCFVHFHEHSLGIMCYYFPEADHYVCDETFTVLRTYDVFPSNVVYVGGVDNIWNYTDSFYMFKNKWKSSHDQAFLVDELERMNDNEIIDIDAYKMPFEIFGKDFDFAEAVYTGEKTTDKTEVTQ